MSHFAELDENNIVLRVLVGDNDLPNEGYDWFVENLGGTWIQTSYNSNFRNKFAGIGDAYLPEYDVFVIPKPFESWTLNTDTFIWEPPVPYPEDGGIYNWNEDTQSWDLLES